MQYITKFYSRLSGKKEMRDFDNDVEMYPQLPQPYMDRGNKRLSLNDYQGAIEDFSMAAVLDPNYPMNYYNLGVAKFCLKDMRGAIDAFSQAINLKPQTAWFRFNRGLAKCSSGDIVGGIADLTKAIELNPKYVEAHILRGKAKGGFVKGCYNPLNDPELISIFEGDLQSLEQEITELGNRRLLHQLFTNWEN